MRIELNKEAPSAAYASFEEEGRDAIVVTESAQHYCADQFKLALRGKEHEGPDHSILMLSLGRAGLYVPMSPEVLRGLAESATRIAAILEEQASAKTAELFRKAGGGKA